MARRRKTSGAEDFVELVALMPWWVGIVLAVVSYLLLRHLAQPAPLVPLAPGDMGSVVVRSIGTALAGIGQYLVPFFCAVGAAMSAWRRRQRTQLIQGVAQAKGADALDGMAWREFEQLVGEAFRLQGFRVQETGGGGADGGVDLVLMRGGEKFLVQCKQWRAFKVGVEVVRELYGVMAARGATGGFVVTSGRFSADATAFAQGRNIRLVDGDQLSGLIRQARASLDLRREPTVAAEAASTGSTPGARLADPACPKCGAGMVKRTARKGSQAGRSFWGCTTYPACRGVRAID